MKIEMIIATQEKMVAKKYLVTKTKNKGKIKIQEINKKKDKTDKPIELRKSDDKRGIEDKRNGKRLSRSPQREDRKRKRENDSKTSNKEVRMGEFAPPPIDPEMGVLPLPENVEPIKLDYEYKEPCGHLLIYERNDSNYVSGSYEHDLVYSYRPYGTDQRNAALPRPSEREVSPRKYDRPIITDHRKSRKRSPGRSKRRY
jgi:hypothetical protein